MIKLKIIIIKKQIKKNKIQTRFSCIMFISFDILFARPLMAYTYSS